ncbi:hypothetical protein AFLA_006480 [Aspergillus flavus NRRL3357]|nr:hypothetical protein AFLA_006480 [Aspergillus flavus NRRL3357]
MPKLPIHLENQTIGAFPEANYNISPCGCTRFGAPPSLRQDSPLLPTDDKKAIVTDVIPWTSFYPFQSEPIH